MKKIIFAGSVSVVLILVLASFPSDIGTQISFSQENTLIKLHSKINLIEFRDLLSDPNFDPGALFTIIFMIIKLIINFILNPMPF